MIEAAHLISASIGSLATAKDPGRILDAFPRQLDRKDDLAAPLIEMLWSQLEDAPVIPDAGGQLRRARQLYLPPTDNIAVLNQWLSLVGPTETSQVVHPTCLERQRFSRLTALSARLKETSTGNSSDPRLNCWDAAAWFTVASSAEPSKAIRVLHLAEAYSNSIVPGAWNVLREKLRIIPVINGELATPGTTLLAPAEVNVPGRFTVHADIYTDEEAKRILTEVLNVRPPDDAFWIASLQEAMKVPTYPVERIEAGWRKFWAIARMAPDTTVRAFFKSNFKEIRVRRRDGKWTLAAGFLLPGKLVSVDDATSNQNCLVDAETHGGDSQLLVTLGVTDFPKGFETGAPSCSGMYEWLASCRNLYQRTYQNSAKRNYLSPSRFQMPAGWVLLDELEGRSNAILSAWMLGQMAAEAFSGPLVFGHETVATYPDITVPHPLSWVLLRKGTLQVGDNTVRLRALYTKREEPALARLPDWERLRILLNLLADITEAWQTTSAELRELWLALIETPFSFNSLADESVGELLAGAAHDGVIPAFLVIDNEEVPISEIFVTGSADLARRARAQRNVTIVLPEPALGLWIAGGARDLFSLITPEWETVQGPPDRMEYIIPELAEELRTDVMPKPRAQLLSGLRLQIGASTTPVSCIAWNGTLLMDNEQLASLTRVDRFRVIVEEAGAAGWLINSPHQTLQRVANATVIARRAEVASHETLAARLLNAVGSKPAPLVDVLGRIGEMDFVKSCTLLELAELVLSSAGPAALLKVRGALADEGLQPPNRWSSSDARAFVASIGFPQEFAVSSETRREAEEFVNGPFKLPPLHDFQEEVLAGISELIASGTTRRRAVVSLPTGGGKTRVTVQAAVKLVLAPPGTQRIVIWIAQTDELCEQVVQAFRQVWVNLGAERTDLRIVRLWGGNANPAIQNTDNPIVVVATIQTLIYRTGDTAIDWLRKPSMVVVDECHHAITASYSKLLRWLEVLTPDSTGESDEPVIVGLSATPFRSDDEESHRLAKRFDSRWLPQNQEHLHVRLRNQEILAAMEYEPLPSGSALLASEIERLSRLDDLWEGLDFDNLLEEINQRLAGDLNRNQRLIERIKSGTEQSILFFSNSVTHAEEISARLNLAGIRAAAISGNTPTVARRHFLNDFQKGDIRVICNHSVLTTGFDAPKVDMILIARQVFSTVRYMQMVGRGLRGLSNGGTSSCKIVTVMDNLGRFESRHPFHYCRDLYQ